MAAQLDKPRFEDLGFTLLSGLAKQYTPDKLPLIPVQWAELRAQLQFITGRVGGKFYGVWNDVLSGRGVFMYFTGVQVGQFAPIHPDFSRVQIEAQRYAVFAHRGPMSEVRRTAEAAVGQWLPKSGYVHSRPNDQAPDFLEVYGETYDLEKGVGDAEIWLPVKK